jgi:carbamoyl-phosphate synthase large subunit
VSVKSSVFPFAKFAGVDTVLGPEMKSTGEVMGMQKSFGGAFAKSQFASSIFLPEGGTAFLSIKDADKHQLPDVARRLIRLGFTLVATDGTANFLRENDIEVRRINKVREGSPHIVEALGLGEIDLVINTPEGRKPVMDSKSIRLVANEHRVPTYTTIAATKAAVEAIELVKNRQFLSVQALQDYLR